VTNATLSLKHNINDFDKLSSAAIKRLAGLLDCGFDILDDGRIGMILTAPDGQKFLATKSRHIVIVLDSGDATDREAYLRMYAETVNGLSRGFYS